MQHRPAHDEIEMVVGVGEFLRSALVELDSGESLPGVAQHVLVRIDRVGLGAKASDKGERAPHPHPTSSERPNRLSPTASSMSTKLKY